MTMPTIFLGHGSPMNAIADNEFTKSLKSLKEKIPQPKSILVISAHWETNGTWITGMNKPKTIHEFCGFPKELNDIQYQAPGAPDLAQEISNTLSDQAIKIDTDKWGLDHGAWSVLRHIYPNADIPIAQMSLDTTKSFTSHFDLGQRLKFLRDRGVLIIGSGNIVHNLRKISWDSDSSIPAWASEFDTWVKNKIIERSFSSLIEEVFLTELGRLSVPTPEHYLPLLYVAGASDSDDFLTFEYEGFQNASISMRCIRFYK